MPGDRRCGAPMAEYGRCSKLGAVPRLARTSLSAEGTMGSETKSAFSRALISDGPSLPDHAQLFAPFIGSWDLIVRWYDKAGKVVRTEAGEWHFSWVLEGRAIQDVWIVPPRSLRYANAPYEYGSSIRFYDPVTEAWQSTWIGPMHRVVWTFAAKQRGPAVVLETTPDVSPAMRWSFTDITANSFLWKNEIKDDDSWRTQQTFEANRQAT